MDLRPRVVRLAVLLGLGATCLVLAPPLSAQNGVDCSPEALQEVPQDAVRQAYALGWRCESGVAAEEFLRQFWVSQLQRMGVAAPPGEDWRALYARAQQITAERGAANVAASGNAASIPPGLPPGTAQELFRDQYADIVRRYRRLLPDSLPCFFRLTSRNLFVGARAGSIPMPRSCEEIIVRQQLRGPLFLEDVLNATMGVWRDAYRDVSNWTPPPEYLGFHTEFLGAVALLDLAADTETESLTGRDDLGRPWTLEVRNRLRLDARSLAVTADERLEGAWRLFDSVPGR
jgi:hypothetical protein